jgi:phosphate:Na+ symporter
VFNYLNFFAGIALLLLGVSSLRRGSERCFGARLRRLLQTATQGRLRAFGAGLLISILTPSSTAVALLSVEAINAGYMGFQQVLALMLGANLGFTITVQLLAFKFYAYYGLFVVPGGRCIYSTGNRRCGGPGCCCLGLVFCCSRFRRFLWRWRR